MEPEVDLTAFLIRQRMEDSPGLPIVSAAVDDNDVDHSLAHITSNPLTEHQSRKGKIQQIDWDASLEEMQHDKNVARAQSGACHLIVVGSMLEWLLYLLYSDLKERLRVTAAHQMGKMATREHACRKG